MGALARWAQVAGLLLFAATGLAVVEQTCQHPRLVAASHSLGRALTALDLQGCRERVPAEDLAEGLASGMDRAAPWEALWEARRWYPYLLAPCWLLALAVAAGPRDRSRRRRAAGAVLLGLGVLVAGFEAVYLGFEYEPILPALGRLEVLLAWLVVVAVLFLRRAGDRGIAAVEAHVGAQSLLGALHLLTLPTSQGRVWLADHPLADVVAAVTQNFRPAFWSGVAGLMLAAGAVYVRSAAGRSETRPPDAVPAAAPAAAVTASRSP